MSRQVENQAIVQLSSKKFLIGCFFAALALILVGRVYPFPAWLVAAEVLTTILALFVLGSIRYRLNKNALTYGAVFVITATFWETWWRASPLRTSMEVEGLKPLWDFLQRHLLSFHSLERLVHADTMLFILGLTFFVSVIAQTRLLEGFSFSVLKKNRGFVLPTVAILTGIVSFASGIFDGVSMIGLMIRTLVIILLLVKEEPDDMVFAIIISTVVTTVCGMWLAYGEPPNLIMKSNLHPYLGNAFFLRYCLPVAVGSYLVVYWNLRKRLKGEKIEMDRMDILDLHTADVRFIQATKHGEVLTPIEFIEDHRDDLGPRYEGVLTRLQQGEPLGSAFIAEGVEVSRRKYLLGKFVSEEVSDLLDAHYQDFQKHDNENSDPLVREIKRVLEGFRKKKKRAQMIGGLSFIPFVGGLIWHGFDHSFPLFWSSFAGFAAALLGIFSIPKMRWLALKDAFHEYLEYLFLFPLFFSISLLQATGFFDLFSSLIKSGIEKLGLIAVSYIQFTGATFLSAMLDNNVVADFSSRALHGLEIGVIHLFAMCQIAGYAAGGCWTHIGSAQSVVAYAFVRREVDETFTPLQWIRAMTPVILEIFLLMVVVIVVESSLVRWLG